MPLWPWWIATDQLARGGKRVLGPFATRDLALAVRDYVERVEAPRTFWVDQGVPSCGNPPIPKAGRQTELPDIPQPEVNRPEQWSHKHRCIRCQKEFQLGSTEVCPRVCDGGEHESPHLHWFKPGRLDGLCAETDQLGLMCGYAERDDFIHTG